MPEGRLPDASTDSASGCAQALFRHNSRPCQEGGICPLISSNRGKDTRNPGSLFCISISDPLEMGSILYRAYVVIPRPGPEALQELPHPIQPIPSVTSHCPVMAGQGFPPKKRHTARGRRVNCASLIFCS